MTETENYKKVYKQRIERFKKRLSNINEKWINKRSWFEDLRNFELGKKFFPTVLYGDVVDPKDKRDFYIKIFIYATLDAKREFGPEKNNLECGLEIEHTIDNKKEEKIHQEFLDYLWWIAIYKMTSKENQFNGGQKSVLEDVRKELSNRVQRNEII